MFLPSSNAPILEGVKYEATASVKLSGAGEGEAGQTINIVAAMVDPDQNLGKSKSTAKGDRHLLASDMARIRYLC